MPEAFPRRLIILQRQIERLRALLDEIIPANRFYMRKFDPAGVTAKINSMPQFVEEVPFTFKQELVDDQIEHPPYGTNLTYPLERYVRCHQTSGTRGVPLRWLDTAESWAWLLDNWEMVLRVAGVQGGDRAFFAFSFGPFIGFWLAFEAALRLGCLCLSGGGMNSATRVRTILDHGVTVLCCTPSYAIRLAEVAAEEGLDLTRSQVRVIIVAGEPGGSIPATRQRIEQLWPNARVFDHHGMTEVGPVTFECPARPGVLHVMENAFIPEVIDPSSGQAVSPGETGELVLTTLGRGASPLIRYRTGDVVKTALEPICECGRSDLALEGGILGRTDDMVVVRGVNVHPSAVEQIVRQCGGVAEYRVLVDTRGTLSELRLEVEPAADCEDSDALRRKLTQALSEALAMRVPVEIVAPGSLPRFEMKAQRWIKV